MRVPLAKIKSLFLVASCGSFIFQFGCDKELESRPVRVQVKIGDSADQIVPSSEPTIVPSAVPQGPPVAPLAIVAVLNGAPSGDSAETNIDVTVAGDGVLSYKYSLLNGGTCTNAVYSEPSLISQPIKVSLTKPDQVHLCVLGIGSGSDAQSIATPTVQHWNHVVPENLPTLVSLIQPPRSPSRPLASSVFVGGSAITHYRYAIVVGSDCKNAPYSSWIAVGTPIPIPEDSPDGKNTLCVMGKNSSGKESETPVTHSWVIDSSAPTAVLSSGMPASVVNTATLNVTVSGSDVAEYSYAIANGLTSAACTSARYSAPIKASQAIVASNLPDGPNALCVKGIDEVGNMQSVPTFHSWTIDTTDPVITFSSPEGDKTFNSRTLTVKSLLSNISGSSTQSVKYFQTTALTVNDTCPAVTDPKYVNAAPVTAGIATIMSTAASDAVLLICAFATKTVQGTVKAAKVASRFVWTSDMTRPTSVLTNTPAMLTDALTVSGIVVDVTDPALGAAGILNYVSAYLEDSTVCDTAVYSNPIKESDPIPPMTFTKAGPKTVCVKGFDAAGNEGLVTRYSWNVELSANFAALVASTLPAVLSNATALNVRVTGVAGVRYSFALMAAASTATVCPAYAAAAPFSAAMALTQNIVATLGADGGMLLCVYGISTTGVVQKVPSSFRWTKDTIAPTAVLTGTPVFDLLAASPLAIKVSGTGVVQYRSLLFPANTDILPASLCAAVSLADVPFINIATMITNLPNVGYYVLCVQGRDSTGNIQPSYTTYAFNRTDFTATVSGLPDGIDSDVALDVTVSGTGITGYQSVLASGGNCGATYAPALPGQAVATKITTALGVDGQYTLCVKGVINGAAQKSPIKYTWIKDAAAPSAGFQGGPAPGSTTKIANLDVQVLSLNVNNLVSTYQFVLATPVGGNSCPADSAYSAPIASTTKITVATGADGLKILCVKGIDIAGNKQANPTSILFTKDSMIPISIIAPAERPAATDSRTSFSFTVTVENAAAETPAALSGITYKYALINAANCDMAVYSTTSYSLVTKLVLTTAALGVDGQKTLCIKAKDLATNEQPTPTIYSWVKGPVLVNLTGAPTGTTTTANLSVTVRSATGPGVTQYRSILVSGAVGATLSCPALTSFGAVQALGVPIATPIGSTAGARLLCVVGVDAAVGGLTQVIPTKAAFAK